MRRRSLMSVVSILVFSFFLFGCGEETTEPENGQPDSPPVPDPGTMSMDLSNLSESGQALRQPEGLCHAGSAILVGVANTAVFVYTVVPRVALIAALVQQPEWTPPATWTWSYPVETQLDTASVELVATVPDSLRVQWGMTVSGTRHDLEDFLWVSGESMLDASEGHWLLYDPNLPVAEQEALRIEWVFDATDDRSLDFLNVNTSSEGVGDTLSYSISGSDAMVSYHDVDNGVTRVEWDVDVGNGEFHGAQGDSCCWGAAPTYPNVECDEAPAK